jgi:hypothetical protein
VRIIVQFMCSLEILDGASCSCVLSVVDNARAEVVSLARHSRRKTRRPTNSGELRLPEEQRFSVVRCSGGVRGGKGQVLFYRLDRPREWRRRRELIPLGNGYDGHKWGFKVH